MDTSTEKINLKVENVIVIYDTLVTSEKETKSRLR